MRSILAVAFSLSLIFPLTCAQAVEAYRPTKELLPRASLRGERSIRSHGLRGEGLRTVPANGPGRYGPKSYERLRPYQQTHVAQRGGGRTPIRLSSKAPNPFTRGRQPRVQARSLHAPILRQPVIKAYPLVAPKIRQVRP